MKGARKRSRHPASVERRRPLQWTAEKGLYHPLGRALLDAWANGTLALGVPLIQVGQVFTLAEQHEYGVRQKPELRMALFNFNF